MRTMHTAVGNWFSRSVTRETVKAWAMPALTFTLMLTLTAARAFAQLPDFTAVETNVSTQFAPLIRVVRLVIMVVCVLAAAWQGWQGAQGQSSKFINSLLLLMVAGFAASPRLWVELIGLDQVATRLATWGL